MSAFLQRAEDILDIAIAGNDHRSSDVAILIDLQGGMRMLDPVGWSLTGLSAEFGATSVYRVERRGGTVRVEGWSGGQRCLIQRNAGPVRVSNLPGMPSTLSPMRFPVAGLLN